MTQNALGVSIAWTRPVEIRRADLDGRQKHSNAGHNAKIRQLFPRAHHRAGGTIDPRDPARVFDHESKCPRSKRSVRAVRASTGRNNCPWSEEFRCALKGGPRRPKVTLRADRDKQPNEVSTGSQTNAFSVCQRVRRDRFSRPQPRGVSSGFGMLTRSRVG